MHGQQAHAYVIITARVKSNNSIYQLREQEDVMMKHTWLIMCVFVLFSAPISALAQESATPSATGVVPAITPNAVVFEPAVSRTLVPWPQSTVTLGAGESLTTDVIDCTYYREVRVTLLGNPNLLVRIETQNPNGTFSAIFNVDVGSPITGIVKGAEASPSEPVVCVFTMPVLADRMRLIIINTSTTSPATLFGDEGQVYLIN